jgi:hypothetical protein
MSNDLVPKPDTGLARFIEKLNLPEMIAGPAGKAIARLVAGFVDIPAAYLESFTQSIKDRTAARTTVSKEVAAAAAKIAAGDQDVVARAAHNLLAKEHRRQKNKEDIARKTIELLEKEPGVNGSSERQDVSDDWLNVFERYAEDASSEHLQTLWAKLLAGEIRKPGEFSLRTLQFVSIADTRVAEAFQAVAPFMCMDFIPTIEKLADTIGYNRLLLLDEAGLIGGVGSVLSRTINNQNNPNYAVIFGETRAVIIQKKVSIGGMPLTQIGRELIKIIDYIPSEIAIQAVAKYAYDHGDKELLLLISE